MAKRKVVVEFYEEVTVESLRHTTEVEIEIDPKKDTLETIELRAREVAQIPEHMKNIDASKIKHKIR